MLAKGIIFSRPFTQLWWGVFLNCATYAFKFSAQIGHKIGLDTTMTNCTTTVSLLAIAKCVFSTISSLSFFILNSSLVMRGSNETSNQGYLRVPVAGEHNGNPSPSRSGATSGRPTAEVSPSVIGFGGLGLHSPGNSSIMSRWSQSFPIKFKWTWQSSTRGWKF